jgi:hypothetical protein
MKNLLFLALGTFLSMIAYGQTVSMVAGDTNGLSRVHYFNPPEHIERVGFGSPVEYDLDINLDGFNDLVIKCENSYGAMGHASNYLTVTSVDSNDICYAGVDSSFCFNGYKPVYFPKLFDIHDTITSALNYSREEIILSKELWFMNDTCPFFHERVGAKYIAVRLNSHGANGLAWVSLDLFPKNANGFSADLLETGFKSVTTSIPDNILPGFMVYPVPSDGLVNIVIPDGTGNMTATIFDVTGKEILVKGLTAKKTTLKLAHGTYLIKLLLKNKELFTKKIIVL